MKIILALAISLLIISCGDPERNQSHAVAVKTMHGATDTVYYKSATDKLFLQKGDLIIDDCSGYRLAERIIASNVFTYKLLY